ncbi:MAG: hypothetical protein L0H75_00820 [Nitrosospira sp.]|nr:hypothetical protein [Nitrosospira sp.]
MFFDFLPNPMLKTGAFMRTRSIFAAFPVLLLPVLVIAFPGSSVAAEQDYTLCTVGGYFSGSGDKFLSGLAKDIVQKRHIFGDPICNAAWKNGYKTGENFSRTGKPKNQAEKFVFQQAVEFREQVFYP